MSERCGIGGLFNNDEILWFILLFLLLFFCNSGFGYGNVAGVGKC
jgi:hypothetical protein